MSPPRNPLGVPAPKFTYDQVAVPRLLGWNSPVRRSKKLLRRILQRSGDAAVRFDDLRVLLCDLGFEERIRGSHHVFTKPGFRWRMTLQRDGAFAKRYQVAQVRRILQQLASGGPP